MGNYYCEGTNISEYEPNTDVFSIPQAINKHIDSAIYENLCYYLKHLVKDQPDITIRELYTHIKNENRLWHIKMNNRNKNEWKNN